MTSARALPEVAADPWVAQQARALRVMRAKLVAEDAAGAEELAAPIDVRGDDSTPSQHPADVASDLERRELVLTMSVIDRRDLGLVEAALERIATGTYGGCAECGRPIPRERLEVRPQALRDVACERRRERATGALRSLEGAFR